MEQHDTEKMQVAIVGGGPVGLFLACCLQRAGVSCGVFEKRDHPVRHSRSIGIMPVSLELFGNIGLAEIFISEGVKVKEGRAFCHENQIGTLSFDGCPGPYRFILLLPQSKTEQLLARHLNQLDPEILHWNSTVTGLKRTGYNLQLKVIQNNHVKWTEADFVVGCDGKDSFIRKKNSIPFACKTYRDTYIMGDFSDNTSLGKTAAIFLCRQGVIESFPLQNGVRRWVVKTKEYVPTVARQDIEQRIRKRIHHNLEKTENRMLSSFGVEKKFAGTMAKDRILLAGDAAHIVSPIGGQGMNLGWLDGWDASQCLLECFANEKKTDSILQAYSKRRLHIAQKAARRAEFNMAMGRETKLLFLHKWLLRGMLRAPAVSHLLANLFTMHGLKRYPV
jgi:2-polyprenyl-6-methoxyphenol hydroxylase-like FAD-dependent oxidoreductase